MRERVKGEAIRSWEYHVAHLFAALSEAISSWQGGDRGIINKSRDQLIAAYGDHAAQVLYAARHIDFMDPAGRL